MTPEERVDAENGIWMCGTHASLIDRDDVRFTVEQIRNWKYDSEDRAMRMLGQQQGCAQGRLASATPGIRLGPQQTAIILDSGQQVQYCDVFDADEDDCNMTWFVNGFVLQFMLQKRANLINIQLESLVATVHQTKPIPEYRLPMMAFPTETSLFYVEIDVPKGSTAQKFVPTRYYTQATDGEPEKQHYPNPITFDDNIPTPIALRINARTPAMYLLSIDAVISSGDDRETLSIVTPQWVIFEKQEFEDLG
jgi:hypothetical protein